MPLYSYTGTNAASERVHGSTNAENIHLAKQALIAQGIVVEEIFQVSEEAIQQQPAPQVPVQQQAPAQPAQVSQEQPIQPLEQQAPPAPVQQAPPPPVAKNVEKTYFPITDTLRLYAGWLLAWYGLVYSLGSYQSSRNLSFEIPYLMGIYYSPLVLSFTLGSFLFLLMTSLHRICGRGILPGAFFTLLGIGLFVFYRMNV